MLRASRGSRNYDVSADGLRALVPRATTEDDTGFGAPTLRIVLNWFSKLQARVPTGR